MNGGGRAIVALTAVALTVAALYFSYRTAVPKEATWDDVRTEARIGGYRLMTTEELAERYQRDPRDVLIVDTRQEWEYRAGHVRGAVNFPMEPTWWSRLRKKGDLESLLGPDRERAVVFY
jgi:3-mercaptopyruvate sulfurtransferase SseA